MVKKEERCGWGENGEGRRGSSTASSSRARGRTQSLTASASESVANCRKASDGRERVSLLGKSTCTLSVGRPALFWCSPIETDMAQACALTGGRHPRDRPCGPPPCARSDGDE